MCIFAVGEGVVLFILSLGVAFHKLQIIKPVKKNNTAMFLNHMTSSLGVK